MLRNPRARYLAKKEVQKWYVRVTLTTSFTLSLSLTYQVNQHHFFVREISLTIYFQKSSSLRFSRLIKSLSQRKNSVDVLTNLWWDKTALIISTTLCAIFSGLYIIECPRGAGHQMVFRWGRKSKGDKEKLNMKGKYSYWQDQIIKTDK